MFYLAYHKCVPRWVDILLLCKVSPQLLWRFFLLYIVSNLLTLGILEMVFLCFPPHNRERKPYLNIICLYGAGAADLTFLRSEPFVGHLYSSYHKGWSRFSLICLWS
uniref:Uncharacterized protein n=1 Tax=Trypanosoma congolense (strain IL3000) TaxID=1068625 RepID=G0URG5_TRYCI|nr:hypothetical protein, unlikely [Trypanosoma congolense IL3000]